MSTNPQLQRTSIEHTGYTTVDLAAVAVAPAPETAQRPSRREAEEYMGYIIFLTEQGAKVRNEVPPLVSELQAAAQPDPATPSREPSDELAGGRYAISLSAEAPTPLLKGMRDGESVYRANAQLRGYAEDVKARRAEVDGLVDRYIAQEGLEYADPKVFTPGINAQTIESARKQLSERQKYVRDVLRGHVWPADTHIYLDATHQQLAERIARRQARDMIYAVAGDPNDPVVRMAEKAGVDWQALEDYLTPLNLATPRRDLTLKLVYRGLKDYLTEKADEYATRRLIRANQSAAALTSAEAARTESKTPEPKEPITATFDMDNTDLPDEPPAPGRIAAAIAAAKGAAREVTHRLAELRDQNFRDENDQPPVQPHIHSRDASHGRRDASMNIVTERAASQIAESMRGILRLGQKALSDLPTQHNPRVGEILRHVRDANPQAAQALKVVRAEFAQRGVPLWQALTRCVTMVENLPDTVIETALAREILRIAYNVNPAVAFASAAARPATQANQPVRSYTAQRTLVTRATTGSYTNQRLSATASANRHAAGQYSRHVPISKPAASGSNNWML